MLWHEPVMEAVVAFDIMPAARKFVLVCVAAHADEQGQQAWPAVETTIAMAVGLQPRMARRHVAALRSGGYLRETGRRQLDNGREVAVYSVALDEATRLLWEAEASGQFGMWSQELSTPVLEYTDKSGSRVLEYLRLRTLTSTSKPTSKPTQELRSCVRACGDGPEGISMGDPVFLEPPAQGENARRKRWEPDEGPRGGPGLLGDQDEINSPQRGAGGPPVASTPQARLAARFRQRKDAVDWTIRHNHRWCTTAFGRQLNDTGVSEAVFAQMIDSFWGDPALVSRLDPAKYAYKAFLYGHWRVLRTRVERVAVPVQYTLDPRKNAKDKELLDLG